ncbi:MAG TPA: BON domain-containing protein [Candidatus Limnocylindrales bacterium]|nr:BON domain-containing protein [Candidatus Limnocylindrales bacterium]
MRIARGLSVISLALIITGCASTHTPHVYSTPNGEVISGGPPRNPADVALDTALRAELNRYGDLGTIAPNVQVYSQNGVVTLTGTVRNERDREMIDALVRNTSGVTSVNDQLQVSYPPTSSYGTGPRVYTTPPVPAPVVTTPVPVVPGPVTVPVQAATTSDQALANRIVDRLRWDSIPNSWLRNSTVTVNNGNVYLQGYVDDSRTHDAILSALQHTPGIVNIYDQLSVR